MEVKDKLTENFEEGNIPQIVQWTLQGIRMNFSPYLYIL